MKSVLLIGLGRFGRHMAAKLQELHHEVLAVDKNEERVNDALDLVTHAQIGDSTSEAFIASLGVRNFDLCVVAIGDDFQSSLETTALLKEQGARFVLSRAARDVHAKFLLRNGADDVIYPEKQTASWAAVRYSSDHVFDYIKLLCGLGQLRERATAHHDILRNGKAEIVHNKHSSAKIRGNMGMMMKKRSAGVQNNPTLRCFL